MDRPSECPQCGVSWDGHEPAEALVKPSDTTQFELEYYTDVESGGWKCLCCRHVVDGR